MGEDLGVSESRIGMLVGVYALASAVCAIPLVSATLAMDRVFRMLQSRCATESIPAAALI